MVSNTKRWSSPNCLLHLVHTQIAKGSIACRPHSNCTALSLVRTRKSHFANVFLSQNYRFKHLFYYWWLCLKLSCANRSIQVFSWTDRDRNFRRSLESQSNFEQSVMLESLAQFVLCFEDSKFIAHQNVLKAMNFHVTERNQTVRLNLIITASVKWNVHKSISRQFLNVRRRETFRIWSQSDFKILRFESCDFLNSQNWGGENLSNSFQPREDVSTIKLRFPTKQIR